MAFDSGGGGGGGSTNLTDSGNDNTGGHDLYELPNDGDGILLTGATGEELLLFDADGDRDTYFKLADNFNHIALVAKGSTIWQTSGGAQQAFEVSDVMKTEDLVQVKGGMTIQGDGSVKYTPTDVTTISSPQQGDVAYNDGTTGTEGLAAHDGTDWISQVDGTTIS